MTVFGGAKPKAGEPAYEEAYSLGKLLGTAGHAVLTGGYMGTMEAVSRGAAETGAHVIGVTCEEVERWRPNRHNPWVHEERRMPTLQERQLELIECCQAAIALPGGAGTLAEVSLFWNRLIIQAMTPRPLILVGGGWKATFEALFREQDKNISADDRRWLIFTADIHQAVRWVEKSAS